MAEARVHGNGGCRPGQERSDLGQGEFWQTNRKRRYSKPKGPRFFFLIAPRQIDRNPSLGDEFDKLFSMLLGPYFGFPARVVDENDVRSRRFKRQRCEP
jgi:hypothetical protein